MSKEKKKKAKEWWGGDEVKVESELPPLDEFSYKKGSVKDELKRFPPLKNGFSSNRPH